MISVIMLTYNRENLVGRAIDCVLAQTLRKFEFIVVDNGSADSSGQIADSYAERDNRIRVIHKEKGNIGSGRNAGLNVAAGDYIAFIDDDDWIEPDYLEFLYNLLSKNGADVSICGTSKAFSSIKQVMTGEEAIIQTMWRKLFKVGFPGKLFRREVIGKLRFPENTVHDDCFLMHEVLSRACRVAYDGALKYHIMQDETSTSGWTKNHQLLTPDMLEELLLSRKLRTKWCSEKYPNHAALFSYFEWSFMISMVEKIHRLKMTACSRILDSMATELAAHKVEFLNSEYSQDFERQWMKQYIS